MDKDYTYLNANALTPVCKAAEERQTDTSLLSFRLERISRLFKPERDDTFVFTSSGAEAINQVLFSVFLALARGEGKSHFITSAIEDAPTMQMMKRLEDLGCFVKIVPTHSDGTIDLEKLEELITPRTALISITMAQGLTGVIQPVEEIARIAKKKGVLLHIDGTHTAGKFDFSLQEIGADYFTFAGDRIHSVVGSGGLFARKGAPLAPLILGGKSLRGGNTDTSGILSLCAAADQSILFLDTMTLEVARLRDFFEKEILRLIPGAQALFKKSLRLPNTTVISFPHVHQEALSILLKRKKIETLIGGNEMQHLYSLLIASDIDPVLAASSISFSLSRMTTEEDLLKATLAIQEGVLFLQNIASKEPLHLPTTDPNTYTPLFSFGKKLREKTIHPRFTGCFTGAPSGMRYVSAQEKNFHLHLLVDESDGVIADVKFQAFGPLTLIAAGEIGCELMIRKTHPQAGRISADLIDQHGRDKKEIPSFPKEAHGILNQVINAMDSALQLCQDIQCLAPDYDTTPIAWEDLESNPEGIAGWDTFPIEKRLDLVESVIAKEIRPYVELDAGGVKVLSINEQHELSIAYQGACTTCHSSTGSTLSAIQQILRARLYPKIRVIPHL